MGHLSLWNVFLVPLRKKYCINFQVSESQFVFSLQAFQRQVQECLTQLELINKQYRRLARENRTDSSCRLREMVHDGNKRWDNLQKRVAAILRRLKVTSYWVCRLSGTEVWIECKSWFPLQYYSMCSNNKSFSHTISNNILLIHLHLSSLQNMLVNQFFVSLFSCSTSSVRGRSLRRQETAFWCGWRRWTSSSRT